MSGISYHHDISIEILPIKMNRIIKKSFIKLLDASGITFVPSEIDTYLVSYPRSGNSWVRHVIAEMMFGESGSKHDDIKYYVPTIGMSIPKWRLKSAPFHLVKSHEPYGLNHRTKRYTNVIYIVRDPRDVCLSYYEFKKQRAADFPSEFNAFFQDWICGRVWPGGCWGAHVRSWIGKRVARDNVNLLLVKYENIYQSPLEEYKTMAEFLRLDLPIQHIEKAIDHSTIKKMRAKEDKNRNQDPNIRSIQDGGYHKWKAKLSRKQKALILQRYGDIISDLGYDCC